MVDARLDNVPVPNSQYFYAFNLAIAFFIYSLEVMTVYLTGVMNTFN